MIFGNWTIIQLFHTFVLRPVINFRARSWARSNWNLKDTRNILGISELTEDHRLGGGESRSVPRPGSGEDGLFGNRVPE